MSDREVARDIRRDVEAGGGSRWVPVRGLRDAFGRTTLTRKARGELAAALAEVGVEAEPDLETVALDDNVRLYLAETARIREREDAPPPWTEHRRTAVAPAPAWTPAPAAPNIWQRFRAWPAWAQLAAGAAALILIVAAVAGDDSGDGGDSQSDDPPPAQEAAAPDSADDEDEAEERERIRERRRERAKRKRERAKERERIRERRRERRREEARERREREATPPPAEEEPEPASDCDPNYSGCVPPYPPDVNCPEVDGPVTVIGDDPHGLDRDGDKQACEN